MKIENMRSVPSSRSEFERNTWVYGEMLRAGRISIAAGIPIDSLLRMRQLPNGRLDMLSVDDRARLQMNTIVEMTSRFRGAAFGGEE